eukprot:SAG11_NODE_25172_length_362_cov_1.669202_1_plen_68_part_01
MYCRSLLTLYLGIATATSTVASTCTCTYSCRYSADCNVIRVNPVEVTKFSTGLNELVVSARITVDVNH